MKPAIVATALLLVSAQSGLAETCHEKFVRLMTDGNEKGPVKTFVIQNITGGQTSTNEFFQASPGHWMTKMIEPANQPWTLTYNNTMFISSDGGKSWKKIRTLDSAQNAENSQKNQQENAKTVTNAVCSEEKIDGVAHDKVEADFKTLQNSKTSNHYKFWVNRQTGWISKASYHTKAKGFESTSTQFIEAAPDLKLPTPE